jgi:hypothetical protein
MAHQAQETFVAEIDGAAQLVQKGTVLGDKHPLVKLDAGRGLLFKPLDVDEAEPPRKTRSRVKAAAASGTAQDDGVADDGAGDDA